MKWIYSRIASAGCQEGGNQKMTGFGPSTFAAKCVF